MPCHMMWDCSSKYKYADTAYQMLMVRHGAVGRWQSRIAKQAGELVGKEEEEDLYFEGGHHSQEFVKLVVSVLAAAHALHISRS